MSRICVSVAAVCVLLSAPAAGQESALREGLNDMARNIAGMLNREAEPTGERLRVNFRPARTVQAGTDIYCGPLSSGLPNALHERVEWWRKDMGLTSFEVTVADARAVEPPDVTLSWAWDGAESIEVAAHVLLAGERGARYSASLPVSGLGERERACLFTFRPGDGRVEAKRAGVLSKEPTFGEEHMVRLFSAGEPFLVRGKLSSAGENGVVWSVVLDSDTGRLRYLFVANLAGSAVEDDDDEAPPDIGSVFRECPHCPKMVVVPSGRFTMGSPPSEAGRDDDEGPQHEVTIGSRFAVGVYEVMFAEWDACVSAGGCGGYRPDDSGIGRGRRPVTRVSWEDAQSYAAWLSGETGEAYRLLSESEWEYVARAGTRTRYWWGDDIGRNRANCWECGSRWDNQSTAPVGGVAANDFGLHDVHGNVWEWVQDCWNASYDGAPDDGSAWESGNCSLRVLRGGSWYINPSDLRAAFRYRSQSGNRGYNYGFRVARTFTP